MFALMHSTRLESLHLSVDPVTGLKAVIAIHNSRLGPALGGCRYLSYPDDESAVADAARLAQGKRDPIFRTKPHIALELVEKARTASTSTFAFNKLPLAQT